MRCSALDSFKKTPHPFYLGPVGRERDAKGLSEPQMTSQSHFGLEEHADDKLLLLVLTPYVFQNTLSFLES